MRPGLSNSFQYSGSSLSGSGGSIRRSMAGGTLGYSRSSFTGSGLGGGGVGVGVGLGGGMRLGGGLGGSLNAGWSSVGSSSSMSAPGGFASNEKQTMIDLNSRLSVYLQKVRDLEEANTKLELQLREFQGGKAITGIDYDAYDAVIKPLREQILTLHLGNARLALDLDNAALAAKDFKNKFENEFYIKQSVEADIADLGALKDEYIRNYKDLESEIAASKDELAYLKKNHEEELAGLRQQVTGTVSVAVEPGPTVDLAKQLQTMRDDYEGFSKKTQEDLDNWYKLQVESQTVQTTQVNEAAAGAKLEVSELRKQLQPLEVEYNSLLSGNASMEAYIQDINDKYYQKLQTLQMTISKMELDLTNIRNEMQQKVKDYDDLLNVKMKLETEIANYKKLLDGSAVGYSSCTEIPFK
ncbi:keratin, type I cytoskeletal 18-like isoform X1 [Cetorhinus maximus]